MTTLARIGIVEFMTLKEITDLLGVRHNNAMITVAKMATDPGFGSLLKFSSQYTSGKNTVKAIQTYQLDKRQSIAVAARLNTSLLTAGKN